MSGKRVSTRLAQKAILPPPPPPVLAQEEDEDVEVYEDYDELDEDDEYDSEAEAQAEALAQQMTDQLAAEIGKVYHFKSDGTADPIVPVIRHLLELASSEPRLQSALTETRIVDAEQHSILDLLSNYLTSGQLSDSHTLALSRGLLNLLNTPLIEELEPITVIGKRKRDQQEHAPLAAPTPPPQPSNNIESRIRAAVDTVHRELISSLEAGPTGQLSPSIKPQLGQIYQFTTTYADAAESSSSYLLRQISKLIKDTEILDRSQLAYPPIVDKNTSTAVFPCYRHPCSKLFASTSALTAHSRTHATSSTVDPKPKAAPPKVTITLQYQCDACKDLFSGRDALRRHQDNASPACTDATANVIEHREETSSNASGGGSAAHEDGELDPEMLARAQDTVVRLQEPLKERAERARAVASASRGTEELMVELDELGTEVIRRTPVLAVAVPSPIPVPPEQPPSAQAPVAADSMAAAATGTETVDHDTVILQQDENARLEQAMLKMMEDAQAEAEAEVMMDLSDIDVDIDDADD